jgi:hypothetical protein
LRNAAIEWSKRKAPFHLFLTKSDHFFALLTTGKNIPLDFALFKSENEKGDRFIIIQLMG